MLKLCRVTSLADVHMVHMNMTMSSLKTQRRLFAAEIAVGLVVRVRNILIANETSFRIISLCGSGIMREPHGNNI